MDLFTPNGAGTARASRFSPLGESAPTSKTLDDGTVVAGRVYLGKDRNGEPYIVHAVNGAEVALPSYAAAVAVASGKCLPAPAVVAAFVATGKLAALKRAVSAAEAAEAAAK